MASKFTALIALTFATVSIYTPVRADGVVGRGNEKCDWDQVVVHGVTELKVEKEMDGMVDVSNPRVKWTCHNSNNRDRDGVTECPATTNRFLVHRQKADNDEWLYECRVKS